ncbi:MAG: hydantoinase/oxoprolinase family protein [Caldilineaceae bacterium]
MAREWREYERTSSTVMNAYLMPSVRNYLTALTTQMATIDGNGQGYTGQVLLTKSDGGLTPAAGAGRQPDWHADVRSGWGCIGGRGIWPQLGCPISLPLILAAPPAMSV